MINVGYTVITDYTFENVLLVSTGVIKVCLITMGVIINIRHSDESTRHKL